jgi:DNA-binding beta-propeller fold protein YncE
MNDRKLSERLETVEVPDERAAEERSWRVVRAAYEQRQPARRTRPRVRAAAIPVALALVALAVAASGTAVGDWLRDLARPGRKHAHPALSSLPGGGRLLVTSASGPWVVKPDGSKRLLGAYDSASWSPHGLFVVATRGQQLAAVEPNGRVRWTLARRAAIRDPRWSPSGYRIAYRTAGTLRVVAGDGTGDRLLARATAATPAAWKPGPGHVIAFARRDGSVLVVGADSRRTLARSEPGPRVEHVAWSADGRRLYSVDTLRQTVFVRDYDAATGAVGERRTHLRLEDGHPDGCTIDAEDHLWVAVFGRGEVRRYAPDGAHVATVEVPAPHTTSVAFAGGDLRTLVITTGSVELSDEERRTHPLSGHLFTVRTEVPGRPAPYWRGLD